MPLSADSTLSTALPSSCGLTCTVSEQDGVSLDNHASVNSHAEQQTTSAAEQITMQLQTVMQV